MTFLTVPKKRRLLIISVLLCVFVPFGVGMATVTLGTMVPIIMIGLSLGSLYLVAVFKDSFIGVFSLLFLGFFSTLFARELVEIPLFAFDLLALLTFAVAIFQYKGRNLFAFTNDLTLLMGFWLIWSLLQVVNPEASFDGWIRELRLSAWLPLLLVVTGFLVFNKVKQLDLFFIMIIGFSTLAALNGIKQEHIGLSQGEQQFLVNGGAVTHLIFGKLRIFSFYNDAGQFGASQAHIGLMALILSFGPMVRWKRLLLILVAMLMLYGMLISGTRGSLFALLPGAAIAVALWKDMRFIIIGSIAIIGLFCFLKFTYIGNGNYAIYRLRSAVNPEDPSLNVRFETQRNLRVYLEGRPFGGGLGTIGFLGEKYNGDTYLSTFQPDSYWVKVWAMYGSVGFTLWFSMMSYILGRCCGIVWTTRDSGLKIKLMALTAGFGGLFICSYGNEVMNYEPSFVVMLMSWVFVFLGPKFDNDLELMKPGQIKNS